jgi:hypothetical protein
MPASVVVPGVFYQQMVISFSFARYASKSSRIAAANAIPLRVLYARTALS